MVKALESDAIYQVKLRKSIDIIIYYFTPSLEAHALLIMGVSSLQSSINFFLSLSFWVLDLAYAGKNRAHDDTLPVNHSP